MDNKLELNINKNDIIKSFFVDCIKTFNEKSLKDPYHLNSHYITCIEQSKKLKLSLESS